MTDTGPPYPPIDPNNNALGNFALGISPLGTISQFNIWDTIIAQYANSPVITGLIQAWFNDFDTTQDFDSFFDNIWNLSTANGLGLDIWGRIVGVVRTIQVEVGNWFGFAEAQPGSFTFGQGSFWSGQPLTQSYALTDDSFRTLIFAKAASNITNGSIPAINQILLNLFPNRGNAYVTEGDIVDGAYFGFAESITAAGFNQAPFYSGEDLPFMRMAYVFDFQLTPVELAIVQQSGVLPKSTGVKSTVIVNP